MDLTNPDKTILVEVDKVIDLSDLSSPIDIEADPVESTRNVSGGPIPAL